MLTTHQDDYNWQNQTPEPPHTQENQTRGDLETSTPLIFQEHDAELIPQQQEQQRQQQEQHEQQQGQEQEGQEQQRQQQGQQQQQQEQQQDIQFDDNDWFDHPLYENNNDHTQLQDQLQQQQTQIHQLNNLLANIFSSNQFQQHGQPATQNQQQDHFIQHLNFLTQQLSNINIDLDSLNTFQNDHQFNNEDIFKVAHWEHQRKKEKIQSKSQEWKNQKSKIDEKEKQIKELRNKFNEKLSSLQKFSQQIDQTINHCEKEKEKIDTGLEEAEDSMNNIDHELDTDDIRALFEHARGTKRQKK